MSAEGRRWTIHVCLQCGAAGSEPEDVPCVCVGAAEKVEVVPASTAHQLAEALREIAEHRHPATSLTEERPLTWSAHRARQALAQANLERGSDG